MGQTICSNSMGSDLYFFVLSLVIVHEILNSVVESLSGNSLSTYPAIKIDGLFDNRDNYWRLVKLTLPLALFYAAFRDERKSSQKQDKAFTEGRTQVHACGNVILLGLIMHCVQLRHKAVIIRTQQGYFMCECVLYNLGPGEIGVRTNGRRGIFPVGHPLPH